MLMNADVVDRLYYCLTAELERSRSAPYERPITVAEIYQDLAPYRSVRSVIGVEVNQDYEHALMRLLAGEDGRVRLEPSTARGDLERELRSSNPNITLYRKYAACDVWVQQPPRSGSDAADTTTPTVAPTEADPWAKVSPAPGAPADATQTGHGGRLDEAYDGRVPAEGAEHAGGGPAPAPGESGDVECTFCGTVLPGSREVRFCPGCGADQRKRPCPSCGEVLDASWQYCIRCGSSAGPLDSGSA